MKHKYEVIVGNVGTMEYSVAKLAKECYNTYVSLSQGKAGRVANEPVTLIKDGEIIAEHNIMNYTFTEADIKLIEEALCQLTNHASIDKIDQIDELIEYIHKQTKELN